MLRPSPNHGTQRLPNDDDDDDDAMIEYIFELPLNNYAISTFISLTSYDSK